MRPEAATERSKQQPMASLESHHPHLRLVGRLDALDGAAQRAREAVAAENRAAQRNTSLDPTDPRWVLAARAYSQLQGTALTFDRRAQLMRTARHLGVRPFDANLIIAIVQDRARRGEDLGEAAGTLAMIERPAKPRHSESLRWAAAIATALVANALLIWWVVG